MSSQILAALGLIACLAYALHLGIQGLRRRRAQRPPKPQPSEPVSPPVEWEGNVARPDFRAKRQDKRTLH